MRIPRFFSFFICVRSIYQPPLMRTDSESMFWDFALLKKRNTMAHTKQKHSKKRWSHPEKNSFPLQLGLKKRHHFQRARAPLMTEQKIFNQPSMQGISSRGSAWAGHPDRAACLSEVEHGVFPQHPRPPWHGQKHHRTIWTELSLFLLWSYLCLTAEHSICN